MRWGLALLVPAGKADAPKKKCARTPPIFPPILTNASHKCTRQNSRLAVLANLQPASDGGRERALASERPMERAECDQRGSMRSASDEDEKQPGAVFRPRSERNVTGRGLGSFSGLSRIAQRGSRKSEAKKKNKKNNDKKRHLFFGVTRLGIPGF